ncbi:HNH endonuclease [Demequina sp. SYSU T00068]|uniref:HNH endonuclease n=1 Tax=Demequina lignilytica TaxID=3051663 RepID=UPI002638A765|nr:HNH endonuclease [Demequina sp. SYSU T00068]MDN4489677.1 HNH endonuclease [Demequina sp. SYSU T00068]
MLKLWTPERLALSNKRKRATAARNAYLARMRALGLAEGAAESVDPLEVFEEAGWRCGICGDAIDANLKWPDPRSKTLDHIDPVASGGLHERQNLQPAHLICNIVKGNGA